MKPFQPTSQNRIDLLDILRGFAVLGILFMNIYSYSGAWRPGASLSTLDQLLVQVGRFFIEAKFYSLFSFLFGVGAAMQMLKAQERDTKFAPFFLRRMFFLFVIGLIHGIFFWPGDILAAYALLGTLLLLFRNRSNKFVLGTALACFLVGILLATPTPGSEIRAVFVEATAGISQRADGGQAIYATGNYLQITVQRFWQTLQSLSNLLYTGWYILPMMLMGLYAGRQRIFEDISANKGFIRRVTIIGLAVGLIFNALFVWFSNPNGLFGIANLNWIPTGYDEMFRRTARIIGAPAMALFYAGAITLLVERMAGPHPNPSPQGRGAKRFLPLWGRLGGGLYRLAPVGRMALSNYLLQTLIATMIFYNYGLGFFGQASVTVAWLIAIVILAFQIQFSAWQLERYRFGPAEWLWRSLSYGKLQPWRIAGEDDGSDSTPSRLWLGLVGLALLAALCYGLVNTWQNISETEQAEIVSSLPSLRPTPTVTPRPRAATATPTPIRATPAVEPVSRVPGPSAKSGDLWDLALAFDVELAYDEVAHLSAPPYNGRHFASPGGIAAGNYIARKFEEYGLRPAGDDNSYFQPFIVGGYTWLTETPSLEITAPTGQTSAYESPYEFAPLVTRYMGAGNGEGPVVWANDCNYNDFDGIDVSGKIVFCRDKLWYARQADVGRNALEHGAVGLLLLADEAARPIDLKAPNREVWVPEPIPTLRVGPSAAEQLLAGSGLTLEDLTVAFASFPLSTTAKISVQLETDPTPQGRNVLGVLPGRDPEYADEVIILGAHYDHMGQDPNGVTWAGANDDASGVAVLLELARSWQAEGYVPRRTILFAAWDAEEAGLLGSTYYVENWRYPLTATIAMLQLDMVGAGEDTLYIDGDGPLTPQLQAIAASVGVTATNLHIGRSDHAPFADAGIPANMLIWFGGESTEATAHYHRPDDTIEVIEPEKLQAVGRITALTALALAEGEPALKDLLGVRLAALYRNDAELFLATSTQAQRPFDQPWFNALQNLNPSQITYNMGDPLIVGRTATATVRLNIAYPYGEEEISRSGTLPVRFVHEDNAWRWDGPALQHIQPDDGFAVFYPPGQKEKTLNLSQVAGERYRAISAQLGLPAQIEAPLILYPDSQSLRADTDLTLPADIDSYIVTASDTPAVKLVYSPRLSVTERFTATLVQLALAQTGLTENDIPWLWHGLPHLVSAQSKPIESQKQYLPGLSQSLLTESETPVTDSLNWAAVDYLHQQIGWDGIGQLAQAVGAGQSVDAALNEVAGMDSADFQTVWQGEWRDQLTQAHTALDSVLNQRESALLSSDSEAFLATVAPADPAFLDEELAWFADFSQKSLSDFNLSAQPIAFYDNGDILAQVEMVYQLASDSRAVNLTFETLFEADEAGYHWAGPPFETLQAENFVIRYPAGAEPLAQETLQQAQAIYRRVQADFAINAPAPFTIKLYPSAEALTASGPVVARSVKQALTAETTPADLRPAIAEGVSRYLLSAAGLESGWLAEGLVQLEAGRIHPDDASAINARNFPLLIKAVEKNKLLPLTAFETPAELSTAEAEIATAQSWDMARYLLERYGSEAVQGYLEAKAEAEESAFEEAFALSPVMFEAEWRESVLRGHARPEWVEMAQNFDAEQAQTHIIELGSKKYAGRQAGSEGERLAAEYIAQQLAAYGLSPAGEDGTFFQSVPISYPVLLSAPRLAPLDSAGNPLDVFRYRQDFLLAEEGITGGGDAEGDVVWIRGEDYGAIRLKGQIVLRRPTAGLEAEIRQAISHGAGGLILVGERKEKGWVIKDLPAKSLDIPLEEQIPVLELTPDGLIHLLEFSQFSFADLNGSAPAVPLDLHLRMSVPLKTQAVSSTNVLALLPGSDATGETVIISAHYDHVGNDPNDEICLPDSNCTSLPGLTYPGLNDDLSGVAAVLELARLWQAEGYQPQRNILFAFWGGEEIDSAGARRYVISPTVPLTATTAMIELEGVGGGTGFYLQGQGDPVREGVLRFSLSNAANQVEGRLDLVRSDRPSDQEVFRRRRIPAMLLYWKGAEQRNFPAEFEDEIDLGALESTGKMTGLMLMTLGR